jgi:hypothetical protein
MTMSVVESHGAYTEIRRLLSGHRWRLGMVAAAIVMLVAPRTNRSYVVIGGIAAVAIGYPILKQAITSRSSGLVMTMEPSTAVAVGCVLAIGEIPTALLLLLLATFAQIVREWILVPGRDSDLGAATQNIKDGEREGPLERLAAHLPGWVSGVALAAAVATVWVTRDVQAAISGHASATMTNVPASSAAATPARMRRTAKGTPRSAAVRPTASRLVSGVATTNEATVSGCACRRLKARATGTIPQEQTGRRSRPRSQRRWP